MLDSKRTKRMVSVEQTWGQRRVLGILLGLSASPESARAASPCPGGGAGGDKQGESCNPSPCLPRGHRCPGEKRGLSAPSRGFFFFASFLLF